MLPCYSRIMDTVICGEYRILSGRRIFIVEDDPDIRRIVVKLLLGEGANAVDAGSRIFVTLL